MEFFMGSENLVKDPVDGKNFGKINFLKQTIENLKLCRPHV